MIGGIWLNGFLIVDHIYEMGRPPEPIDPEALKRTMGMMKELAAKYDIKVELPKAPNTKENTDA